MSDPKANPDVLHVDGPTRDAIIEWLFRHAEKMGPSSTTYRDAVKDAAAHALHVFPVSAEPSVAESRAWVKGYDAAMKLARGDPVPDAAEPVSAEPSPNPLREALANLIDAAVAMDQALTADESRPD